MLIRGRIILQAKEKRPKVYLHQRHCIIHETGCNGFWWMAWKHAPFPENVWIWPDTRPSLTSNQRENTVFNLIGRHLCKIPMLTALTPRCTVTIWIKLSDRPLTTNTTPMAQWDSLLHLYRNFLQFYISQYHPKNPNTVNVHKCNFKCNIQRTSAFHTGQKMYNRI